MPPDRRGEPGQPGKPGEPGVRGGGTGGAGGRGGRGGTAYPETRAEGVAYFLRHQAFNIVLVLTVLIGGYLLDSNSRDADEKIHRSAIASCERSNKARDAINRSRELAEGRTRILVKTRKERARLEPTPELRALDLKVARLLERNADKIEPLRNPNCREIIPRP